MKKLIFTISGILIICTLWSQEIPQKISYQGKLLENGIPVNGIKNITFSIGTTWSETINIQVTEGLYSVTLGETIPIPIDVFNATSTVTLQITIEGDVLNPQTEILSVPYAFKAEKAVTAFPTGTASGDLSGTYPNPTVSKIQNRSVSNTIPDIDQVLKWDGTQWALASDDTGGSPSGTASGDLSGTYPNPVVVKIQGNSISSVTPSSDQVLKWNGSQWAPGTDDSGTGGDNWGTQFVQSDITLSGDGTSGNPLAINQQGATTGQVLEWNGSAWAPATDDVGTGVGDDWGTQIVQSDATLAGAGISGDSLSIAQQGATTGQVLEWNGSAWMPGTDDTGGLTLPYSGTNSEGSTAFTITNSGSSHAIRIFNNITALSGIKIANDADSPAIKITNYNSYNNDALSVDQNGPGNAAYFNGDVEINGTLSKSSGAFKIDHPLDPENKYLYHSFVESPDMMNVYNGNIVLDNNGEAIVELPEWFEALNKEFRYQLTCIGGYAPVYITSEISNNNFKIAGGTSGMKVSWQVTGVRNDPYAVQNRIQVEVDKTGKERGKYLHYKEYKQPLEKSIKVIKNPELLDKSNNSEIRALK